MGLESGTFLDDLVTTNPIGASDDLNRGDDHIRLVKSVLKNTFPNATKAFRFETVLTKTATYSVVAADARALILADVSGGAFTITLPMGSAVFAGYSVIVEKSDSSANAVTVDGNGAETINGALTRSLTVQYQAEKYMWDGSEWKILSLTRVGTSELSNDSVTFAKMQNITTARLLGRTTAAAGDTEEIAVDATMALSGLVLGVAGSGIGPAQLAALAVTGPKIALNAVDGTHIALGSDAQGDVMYYNGTDWVRLAKGSDTEVLTLASGIPSWTAPAAAITRGTAIATTSGTAHGFTGIAAGANRITFMLDNVSLSGTDELIIELGDAGGYETSGYISGVGDSGEVTVITSGAAVNKTASASETFSGILIFARLDGNTWSWTGGVTSANSSRVQFCSGRKTLSAELDRIQITASGSNTFDLGQVNILIE